MSTRFRSIEQEKGVYKLCDIKEQVLHFYNFRECYTNSGELKKDLSVSQALELISDEYKDEYLNCFEDSVGFKCWDLHLQNNYSSTLSTYYNNLIHLIWQYYTLELDEDYSILLSLEEEADEFFESSRQTRPRILVQSRHTIL